MPKDTKTRYRDVFARHRTGCGVEEDSACTCRPTYWGKVWDGAAGKRRKTKNFATPSAARKAKADLEARLSAGMMPVRSQLRVDQAIDEFLAGARDGSVLNKHGRRYRPSAIRTLAGALQGPVSEAIGGKRIRDVRRADLQTMIVDQLTPTQSGSSVRRVVNSIRSLYTWAHDREHVDHDPAHRLRLPPVEAVPRDRVATPAEFTQLLAVLPIEDALPYALAGYATARRAEIRHACLEDVDLTVLCLYLGSEEAGRKSRAAQRTVPIVRPLASILRRAQLARDPRAGELLCPGRKPGGGNSGLLSCEALQERSDTAWEEAGLRRITLHECRHTAISWLDAAGVRPQVISTIAGHELKHGGAQVTARYTHTLPGDIEQAGALLDAYLAKHAPDGLDPQGRPRPESPGANGVQRVMISAVADRSQERRERTYLDVPFPDNDRAKALGARWDPQTRAWYAPPDCEIELFAHWLTVPPAEEDPRRPIAGLPLRCWKCSAETMAVIACEDEGELVFLHEDILQVIAGQLSEEELARVGAGPLRPRFSKTLDRSAWSNGCVACGALLGGFPLFEEFVECQSTGVELPVIAIAKIPLAVLYQEG